MVSLPARTKYPGCACPFSFRRRRIALFLCVTSSGCRLSGETIFYDHSVGNQREKAHRRFMIPRLEFSRVAAKFTAWSAAGFLLVLITSPAPCGSLQDTQPPESPFPHDGTAQKHLAAGQEELASAKFKLFLRQVLRSLATATAQTGHLDKAEPLFEEALALSPADADLRMEYSRVLFNRSKFLQAKEQAQEAIRLEPQTPEAILERGASGTRI